MNRLIALLGMLAAVLLGITVVGTSPASAHRGNVTSTCDTLSVNLTSYREGQPGPNVWYNFSPNHNQGPFDGPPLWPVSPRGTWHEHDNNGGPMQGTFGTFSTSDAQGHASWFHREHGTPAGVNHVVVTIDGVVQTDVDFATAFAQAYDYANNYESHHYVVTVTAWDDPDGTHGWTFTAEGDSVPCAKPTDASASVSTTAPTCEHGETLVYGDIVNASFSGTPDGAEGPRNYDVVATADAGHAFENGDTTEEFTGSLAGPDESLCPVEVPKDATASVGTTPADCDSDGSATYASENASLVGDFETAPGDHVATFVADQGHEFADGSTTLEVPYTVAAATGNCPQPPCTEKCGPPHHNPPSNPPHHNPPNNPPHNNPPKHNAPPALTVKSLPNAGLDNSSTNYLPLGLAGLLIACGALLLRKRNA